MYNLSGCVFIRNTFKGAFLLPETIAQFLPFVDEIIIGDYGSDDGTIEFLKEISVNPKIKPVFFNGFPLNSRGELDANVFAVIANDLVEICQNDKVLYWQADEVWHEDLLRLMQQRFEHGEFDLSFWRIQYANNFQYVKWFPHLVHRVGVKGNGLNVGKNNFEFNGDGMNTTRSWDARICSNYGGEMFPKWGELGQEGIKPYTNEMITDISLLGGFRDNIVERRLMHAPFWHEEPTIPYYNKITGEQFHISKLAWIDKANHDSDWIMPDSPYNLPYILKYHVGKVRYELRPELLEAIKRDDTRSIVGL